MATLPEVGEHLEVVADGPSDRLDTFLNLSGVLPSRAIAARLARDGRITVNGRPARPSRALVSGDRVAVELPEVRDSIPRAEAIDLDVLYEDADLLVVNKPAGMVVHPGAGRTGGTLVNALLSRHESWPTLSGDNRPGIVHRLDKGTSGLMLVARSDAAHRRLSTDLAERKVSRVYRAIVRGVLEGEGLVDAPIGRDPRDRKRMAIVDGGRAATTRFSPLDALDGFTLLRVELGSGRTHQVRVHLAAIRHPLLGDATYGGPSRPDLIERPALHAFQLRFRHPTTGAEMSFEAEPPADFQHALAALAR